MKDIKDLEKISKKLRRTVLKMCYHAGGGHIAPSFSSIELMTSLYFDILNFNKNNLKSENRDRFILSKGHASALYYAILAEKGIIDKKNLNTFCQKGSKLGGHPESHLIPGVEFSTGSLGHGLSFGAGVAFAGKMDKKNYRTFVLLSDGECQEGSVWEATLFSAQHKLDNLVAIVDHNKLQSLGKVEDIVNLNSFASKWRSFGWEVKEIDGHNISQIVDALKSIPFTKNKPSVIIAHTIKGKGISFMEGIPIWHYRIPSNKEEWEIACKELEIDKEEFKEVFQ